mgnify:CR=1 FL=1
MKKLICRTNKSIDDEFVELVMEAKESMYKIARCRLNNYEDVLDVTQNTILSAYKNVTQLRNKKHFKTWIIKILINECNLFYKKQYKNERVMENVKLSEQKLDKELEPFTNVVNSSIDFKLLMKVLNDTEQLVISLFYSNEFSCKEIAKILDMNENTVKTNLRRAKDKIKLYYDKRGEYSEK